jgi:hypothetical protein
MRGAPIVSFRRKEESRRSTEKVSLEPRWFLGVLAGLGMTRLARVNFALREVTEMAA